MNPGRHPVPSIVCLLLAAAVAAGWSLHRLHQKRGAALAAVADRAECLQLCAQIRRLRERPSMAGAAEMQLNELAALIERAADAAGLPRRQLTRIWPQPARRIGDGPYREKPTQILLRDATLEQAVRFMHEIETSNRVLNVSAVRLSVPRDEARRGAWSVELTLSYLIYAPVAGGHRRADSLVSSRQ